uniref:Glycosyltransferase 2-like domain-containing protein n=1 Tax=viral metagenome TaxID=1070528 RepID=A0A6C0BBU3_9ZZZZ
MDLCLVINTCKSYYSNIDGLIKQLEKLNSYFPKENILIVSGQEDTTSSSYESRIKVEKVEYTGLHLTSAIYICENYHKHSNINYWLLLPDTIIFGDNFFNKVIHYYNHYLHGNEIYSLPLINPNIRPTMDMGFVHTKHILNMTNYLNQIKTYTINRDHLINIKTKLISNEDTILGLLPRVYESSTKFEYVTNNIAPTNFITNHRDELIETVIDDGKKNQVYFVNLDLYKIQRNFNGPSAPIILEL